MKPEIDQNFVLKAKERGRERANDIRDTPLSKKVLARGRALMESYVRAGSKKAHAWNPRVGPSLPALRHRDDDVAVALTWPAHSLQTIKNRV